MQRMTDEALAVYNAGPLYQTIGIRMLEVAHGQARSVMNPVPNVCWPTPGQPHGGIVFTIIDTTAAFAAMSNAPEGHGCATVDCNIQYTAPARKAPFTCQASTTHKAGRTVFVRAELSDAEGAVVALAQATFRILVPRKD